MQGPPRPLSIEDASHGMVSYPLHVAEKDVVFVKGIVEASEGLGAVFADAGGELSVTGPVSRAHELSELLADLAREGVVHLRAESSTRAECSARS
jgi:hypothetical protein